MAKSSSHRQLLDWTRTSALYRGRDVSQPQRPILNEPFRILDAVKAAGANAVKIQTYRADTITINHSAPEFIVKGGLWDGRQLYDLYEEAYTPWDWHGPIFYHAKKIGLTIFSSPFDPTGSRFT